MIKHCILGRVEPPQCDEKHLQKKCAANIILNDKKLDAFPLIFEKKARMFSLTSPAKQCWKFFLIRQKKE